MTSPGVVARSGKCLVRIGALTVMLGAALPAHSQDADELAKQLSNPVASLVSVPLQFNVDEGLGPGDDGDRILLNVQPVIPISLSAEWNLISRTILPLTYQHGIAAASGTQLGSGDVLQSLFVSPKAPSASGWIWGVGPALLFPTAGDDLLGTGKWAAGPTAVALRQTDSGRTYGVLANHLWSYAGDGDRNALSATFLQPFVSIGLGQARTLSLNMESTYDWRAGQWSVPLNVGYSKVTKIGTQLVSWQGGVRYYIERPSNGPDWGLRFVLTLLYPKAP